MTSPNLPPISTQINQLFARIEPTPDRCKQLNVQATLIRQALRARLKKTLAHDLVGGSFGRSTVLEPVKDLDLFLKLDPTLFFPSGTWEEPQQLLEHLLREATAAFKQPDPAAGELKGVAPAELSRLKSATLRLQDHSVGVQLPGESVWFDLVPLLPHKSEPGKWVIPDRTRKTFIFTDPERQHQVMKDAGQAKGIALNRYIRLIKLWNQAQKAGYKSFYLEVMCYDAFSSNPKTWVEGLETLVGHLRKRILEKQKDPTGAGPHIDDGAKAEERQAREKRLLELQSILGLVRALEQSKTSHGLVEAHAHMRKVFGACWDR